MLLVQDTHRYWLRFDDFYVFMNPVQVTWPLSSYIEIVNIELVPCVWVVDKTIEKFAAWS